VSETTAWPVEIRVKADTRMVEVDFDTGERFRLPAEYLRVMSPSAEVQGHGTKKPPPVAGKKNVAVVNAEAVGNYAVRLLFDDGHDTGLFSWSLLYSLGREQNRLWGDYLGLLAAHSLKREP
jgi:DUF971 family protein